jgi:hypothetical protein
MKKKSLHLFFILMFCSLIGSAQEYTFGLKAGVNYNQIGDLFSIGGSIETGTPNVVYTPGSEMGSQFGALFMLRFDRFFIQPEILYNQVKASYDLPLKVSNWEARSIDVPLLFGYMVYDPVSVYFGPTFSSISEMEMDGIQSDFTYAESSMSVNLGMLFEFYRFGLDVRYQFGLTKVEEQRIDMIKSSYGTNLADLLDYNPGKFMVSLHVYVFRIFGGQENRRSRSDWRNHRNL